MPLGRNCVTALPVPVVHRSARAVAAILVISALTTHTSESAGQVGTSGTSAARVSVTTNARRTCQQADQRRRVQGKASGGSKGTGQIGVWSALAIARSSSSTPPGPEVPCQWLPLAHTSASAGCAGRGTGGGCGGVSGGGRGGTRGARGWHWERGRCSRRSSSSAHKDGAQEDRKGDACCLGESDHTSLA